MQIAYRMATENDTDALVRFWRENAGWDQIDRSEWERRFYQTPFGPSAVAIAVDEKSGEVLAQIVFIPSVISVDGRLLKSRRPYAVIVAKEYRKGLRLLSLINFLAKLYNCALVQFRTEGVGLIHMMPDPGWVRAFKFFSNVQTTWYPLWSVPLPLAQPFALPPGYEVRSVDVTDAHIDALCEKNNRLYGCVLPRNRSTLAWKTSHASYRLLGVFRNEELVGLSASVVKEQDKQWLLCDLLAADGADSLRTILQATCNAASQYRQTHKTTISKIAMLVTPLLQGAARAIGFQNDNYRFPMVVQLLDKSVDKTAVAPERWYASAND